MEKKNTLLIFQLQYEIYSKISKDWPHSVVLKLENRVSSILTKFDQSSEITGLWG